MHSGRGFPPFCAETHRLKSKVQREGHRRRLICLKSEPGRPGRRGTCVVGVAIVGVKDSRHLGVQPCWAIQQSDAKQAFTQSGLKGAETWTSQPRATNPSVGGDPFAGSGGQEATPAPAGVRELGVRCEIDGFMAQCVERYVELANIPRSKLKSSNGAFAPRRGP